MNFNPKNCIEIFSINKNSDRTDSKQPYLPRYLARQTSADSFTRTTPVNTSFKGLTFPDYTERTNRKSAEILSFLEENMPKSDLINKIKDGSFKPQTNKLIIDRHVNNLSDKYFANQENVSDSDKKKYAKMLYILSLAEPEKYREFTESKGFEEIKKGTLECTVLNYAFDLAELDGNFFYKYFERVENAIVEAQGKYDILGRCDKEDLLEITELTPEDPRIDIDWIKEAKDPDLMVKMVKKIASDYRKEKEDIQKIQENGGYVSVEKINSGRENLSGTLRLTSQNPEFIKNIEPFMKDEPAGEYSEVAEHFVCLDPLQEKGIIDFAKNYAKENNKECDKRLLVLMADLIKDTPAFGKTIKKISDNMKNNPELKDLDLVDVLEIANKNTADFLTEKAGNLTKKDLYIAGMAYDIEDFKDKAKRDKIISAAEEIIKDFSNTSYIKGQEPEYLQIFSYLINLKLDAPEKYDKIKGSGIFEVTEKEGIGLGYIFGINKNSDFSDEIYSDLQKIKEGKDIVSSYDKDTSESKVFWETKTGDVAEIGGKLYINDGKSMTEWKMSKEKYLELFPPLLRFKNSQECLGNCYFVTTVLDMMRNPETRVKLYQVFEQDGNDINVTIKSYENYGGKVNFKNGEIELDDKNKHMSGCKGLQMLEQAYAKTAFRDAEYDNLTKLTDKTDKSSLMERIEAGYQFVVLSEILGIDNIGEYRWETDDAIAIEHWWKSKDRVKDVPNYLIDKNEKYALYKNKEDNYSLSDFEADLKKYANKNYILSCSTIDDDLPSESTLEKKYNLVSGHAYTIAGYDEKNKIVKLINPHNYSIVTDVPVKILFDNIEDITFAKYK